MILTTELDYINEGVDLIAINPATQKLLYLAGFKDGLRYYSIEDRPVKTGGSLSSKFAVTLDELTSYGYGFWRYLTPLGRVKFQDAIDKNA